MLSTLFFEVVEVGNGQRYLVKRTILSEEIIAVMMRAISMAGLKKAVPSLRFAMF